MRTYIGRREPETDHNAVWIVDVVEGPSLEEVGEVLADLRALGERREYRTPAAEEILARKRDVIERIQASEASPDRRPLAHRVIHSPNGFDWGYAGNGPADLAAAILGNELAVEVPSSIYLPFRDEVIARLPNDRFDLPATRVWEWVREHRPLIDAEVFGAEQPPAQAVTDPEAPADEDDGPVRSTGEPTASALVSACEAAWNDIRAHHAELPDVVVVLGSGVQRGRLVKLGHWWSGRWIADGQVRGEVLLAGEALHLLPEQVFEVLLHEAAHGLNAARGIKDTSRGGRYHNERFATTAREVGLHVSAMPPYGLARTEITPDTAVRYAATIGTLDAAMRIVRTLEERRRAEVEGADSEGGGREAEGRSRGSVGASCGCGRRVRVAPTVLAKGPVVCGVCETEFATGAEVARDEVVDDSFVPRRRAELDAEQTDPRVERWREQFGMLNAEPMVARDRADAEALTVAARGFLRGHGELHGPPLDLGTLDVQTGDRVVVVDSVADGPDPGIPGVVASVDPARRRCTVDFPIWGTVEVTPRSALAAALAYDYAQVGPQVSAAPAFAGPDVEVQQTPAPEFEP